MKLQCYHCSKVNEFSDTLATRVAFRESCTHCSADLHICLNCALYDPGAHHECRESSAEWVREKERSNRCEYFTPRAPEGRDGSTEKKAALSALDDLFKK